MGRVPLIRHRLGLTLGELLISIALLAVVLVFVTGLGLQLTNSSTKGVDQTVALEIGQRLLEQAAHTDPAVWPTGTAAENITVTDPRTPTAFYYTVTDTQITDPTVEPMGDLHRYEVIIFWWPNQPPNSNTVRQGFGRQRLKLSRLIYVENMR